MRVIAGQAGGRRLFAVKGLNTRPTADRVKEAMFNVLAHRVQSAQCLDLFAGTGSLGLEALSRGAQSVLWVEKDRRAYQVIQKNIENLGMHNKGKILQQDVFQVCKRLLQEGEKFDLIFADPPYHREILPLLLQSLNEKPGLLTEKGTIILESHRDEKVPNKVGRLEKRREDAYGDTVLHYYQWEEKPESLAVEVRE
ncbi:16S rRNA (guanine(966)-N(2))-methyltransferase RsmD [Heliorestis acidaminivorans]|uniref:16S rRNA (Guanine(966)-N(2))-methyltransferase RsmD n=1 Tax=Heliorestis acidaminivorans TaxID=553427 RepID=A0A6I0EUL0_9FIRM|nr:16S rRNA (guanine(966)-N(2))-methyltransferase RsmD [Heliorestis acidaminivorans]KAB2954455.1 16S rRNA (guanine(966)-N(2))-methyltransferase RsmD [Heliorestis acidaminivorans]